MRYALAGGLVFTGIVLVGLAAHDAVYIAWAILTGKIAPLPAPTGQ